MRSILVRTTTLCFSILIGCGLAWGAVKPAKAGGAPDRGLPSPAHFLALMEKSKLTYEINLHPAARPVKELSCGERPNELWRVRSGDGWSLMDRKPAAAVEYRRGLELLGLMASFKVKRPVFSPPADALGERQGNKVEIGLAEKDLEWLSYFLCKAVWRNEPEYRRARGVQSEGYSWSTTEERECLTSYLGGSLALAKDDPAALSPQARHLKEVADAGLFDGFLIVADLGPRCPMAIPIVPEDLLDQAEQYIRRFVILRPSPKLSR